MWQDMMFPHRTAKTAISLESILTFNLLSADPEVEGHYMHTGVDFEE